MKGNNKGFSLVELLVSFAILGVISAIIGIMMTSGSNMFAKNRARLNLQYKSQIVASQLHSYLQNCNGGVAVNTNGDLYIAQKTSDESGSIYVISLGEDADADKLFLRQFNISKENLVGEDFKIVASYEKAADGAASEAVENITESDISACTAQPLCSDVSSWNTELNSKYAKVNIEFSQGTANYNKNFVESFRSRPRIVTAAEVNEDDILINTLKERVWG